MSELPWTCRCGAMQVAVTPGEGARVVCYCGDCQGFARHLQAGEILDSSCGSDLFSTLPDRLRLVQGAEHLRALRMTPKGPYRWYAGCCGTPLANGAATRAFPFVSLILNDSVPREALGPVRARLNTAAACGPVPRRGGAAVTFIWAVLWRAARARLAGRHRQTPFFDAAGAPVARVGLLRPEERRAALR